MRAALALGVVFIVPAISFAQTKVEVEQVQAKLETLKYLSAMESPTGGFKPYAEGETGLRATSAAIRAIKYWGGDLPHAEKHAAFVMKCYDPISGGFSELPGGKPDVFITSVGVMAALELGIPKEKFAKAMEYLQANAKTFEDVRIGAAAVEAWGVKDCPFDLRGWLATANQQIGEDGTAGKDHGIPRETASVIAMLLRLGTPRKYLVNADKLDDILQAGQIEDGGWGKQDTKGSDLETCYRVMRAFYLLKEKPKDVAKLKIFVASCRNADGGYGVTPGAKSSVPATYYAAIITKWLVAME